MEDYKTIKTLANGPLGPIRLVQGKRDGAQFVMKTIPCSTKSEADSVLSKAKSLAKLKHPSVASYQDFFLEPSSPDSSVCVLTEYQLFGDLDKILRKRQKQHKAIDENMIKKWLGQMLEVLVYAHDKGVIHLALKPSNMFMTEDLNVVVADFRLTPLSAQPDDAATLASMAWTAPEVTQLQYDDRADIWSLGCVLLQLATCHLVDDETLLSSILTRLKSDPRVLEDLLQQVMVDPDEEEEEEDESKYSIELCALIRSMLRPSRDQRARAADLLQYPYMQECFELIGSTLVDTRRQSGKDLAEVEAAKGSAADIMQFVGEKKLDEVRIMAALKGFKRLFDSEKVVELNKDEKAFLMDALVGGGWNVEIATFVCHIALECLTGDPDPVFSTREFIEGLLQAMRLHVVDVSFLVVATRVLTILSVDEETSNIIGQTGGIQEILICWRCFPHVIGLGVVCCSGLSSLAFGVENAEIVAKEKVVYDVISALRNHGHLDGDLTASEEELVQVYSLVEHACTAILSLSMDKENVEYMVDESTMDLLIDVMLRYGNVARILKCATLAMASLAESDQDSALKFAHESGIPIVLIVRAYDNFKNDEEVVESICSLILELTEYKEVRAAMLQHPILGILKDVVTHFGESELMLRLTRDAIKRLIGEMDIQAKARTQSAKKARARRQSLSLVKHQDQ